MKYQFFPLALLAVVVLGCAVAPEVHAAEAKGKISLKVDFALPTSGKDLTPLPGTLKPGWTPFVASSFADMYMHDGMWENGSQAKDPPKTKGLAGSGVHVKIDTGRGGNTGLHIYGMCRANLGGDGKPTGKPKGDPIANGWIHNIEWGTDPWEDGPWGDLLMRINGLPAGEYKMTMYHNHWEPKSEDTRNCIDQPSKMPKMAGISAESLPSEPHFDYRNWSMGEGTDMGVKSIKKATKVAVSSVLSDDKVAKSVIQFKTDGNNDVLVILAAGDPEYEDPAGRDRGGSKAILNAFEIEQLK